MRSSWFELAENALVLQALAQDPDWRSLTAEEKVALQVCEQRGSLHMYKTLPCLQTSRTSVLRCCTVIP